MRKLCAVISVLALAVLVPALVMASGGSEGPATATSGPIEVHTGQEQINNAKWAPGESQQDNMWTRLWLKEHNVKVVVDWVSAEYTTNLNLVIASGKLPDAFVVNAVQLNQLAAANQLADLKPSFDKYASPGYRKMMEANKNIVETATFNGKLLALPRLHYGFETSTPHVWARKDWMAKAGIKVTSLKSVDDFEKMMDTFRKSFGAEFGIMEDKTLYVFFQLSAMFHSYPQIWVNDASGKIVYGATLPETKTALAKWAAWYAKGYIRSDFVTLDNPAMRQDAYKGRVGIFGGENWAGWWFGSDMVKNQGDDTYFMPLDLPTIDGRKVMYPTAFQNDGYHVVRAGYAHPEVIVKLTNTYIHVLDEAILDGSMKIEQVLPFNTNDMHHVTGPFKVHFAHYRDIQEVSKSVNTGVVKLNSGNAYTFYNEIMKWVKDRDFVGLGRYIQMGDAESSLVHALKHVDDGHLLFSKMWGAAPQKLIDYGTTLDDLLLEGYTKIITGVQPVSYYDTLIQNWRRAGGDEATAAVNTAYGKK